MLAVLAAVVVGWGSSGEALGSGHWAMGGAGLAPAAESAQPFGGGGAGRQAGQDAVTVSAAASVGPGGAVRPGDSFVVAVVFDHAGGWHIWPAAGVELPEAVDGLAMRTEIRLPGAAAGLAPLPGWVESIGGVQWPEAKPTRVADLTGEAADGTMTVPTYGGKAVAYVPVTVAADAPEGPATLVLGAFYQACDDMTCLAPQSPELTVSVRIDSAAAPAPERPTEGVFAGFDPAKVVPLPPPTPPSTAADEDDADREPVIVRAATSSLEVRPGSVLAIAVVFDMLEPFHIWPAAEVPLPEAMDGFAQRTTVEVDSPPRWATVGTIQWPQAKPTPVPDPGGSGEPVLAPTYGGKAIAYVPVKIADDAPTGDASLSITASYQACDDTTCLFPETVTTLVEFRIAPDADELIHEPELFTGFISVPPDGFTAAGPTAGDAGGPQASIFGINIGNSLLFLLIASIIGGAILNLTPCVLPVIPIKIMTLVQHAGGSHGRALTLGIWMAAGVVAFWFAAGLPMALFSAALDPSRLIFGTWWVTFTIGLIIAAMGLGIMGLFMLNLPQSVYMVNPKADTPGGSFMFGVMTAVLGLPCFGFVAGGLLAGTAVLGPIKIMAIFLGLGIGMAAPYIVLSAKPQLVSRIPRTGPASELVKQVMGLLLLAAAAFFITAGLRALLSEKPWLGESMAWWAVAFFITLAGLWLTVRTLQIASRPWAKIIMPALSLLAIAGALLFAAGLAATAKEDYQRRWEAEQAAIAAGGGGSGDSIVTGAWLPYTDARKDKALASGKVVVFDFTADWCINCKALKRGVLDRDPVRSRVQQGDVILIEVDLTTTAAPGWSFLAEIGRSNVPTLAIFGPGARDPIIYNAYTPDLVLAAIEQARGGGTAGSTAAEGPGGEDAAAALGRSN